MLDKELADKLTEIACKQLDVSTRFKRPRMVKLAEYWDLYNGKIPPRFRQQFNFALPVFSGMVDTLNSDFDDTIELKFKPNDPADYMSIRRVNGAWKRDSSSHMPNGKWDLKDRWDKLQAIVTGRGIKKYYAESDPEYKANLFAVMLEYFHFEPKGGGHLENHMFCGEEAIFKTDAALKDGMKAKFYDSLQVQKLLDKAKSTDYKAEANDEYHGKMSRFASMGLDAESENYTGQALYNFCDWGLTYGGKRYRLIFDPWTKLWIRAVELKEDFSNNLWQWFSWSTHETAGNFLNKSYGDDFYSPSMAIIELVMQEMTNRQKRNMGGIAFDRKMFDDQAKLDSRNYRPDAQVPVTVPPGRTIADGIFMFTTPELKGTIDLSNWLKGEIKDDTGVDDLSQNKLGGGGKQGQNVVFAKLQQAGKRIGHKAKSYVESWAEQGIRYLGGLVDNLGEPMAIELLGKEGYGWDFLRRSDLKFKKQPNFQVVSMTEQDKQNVLGKDQKLKTLEMIVGNPLLIKQVNPKLTVEVLLRDGGGWEDDMISQFLDTQNYGTKEIMAHADLAIRQLAEGEKPKLFYGATTAFLQRILTWANDHRDMLQDRFQAFEEFILAHEQITTENMMRQAALIKRGNAGATDPNNDSTTPPGAAQPAPTTGAKPTRPVARANPAQRAGVRRQAQAA